MFFEGSKLVPTKTLLLKHDYRRQGCLGFRRLDTFWCFFFIFRALKPVERWIVILFFPATTHMMTCLCKSLGSRIVRASEKGLAGGGWRLTGPKFSKKSSPELCPPSLNSIAFTFLIPFLLGLGLQLLLLAARFTCQFSSIITRFIFPSGKSRMTLPLPVPVSFLRNHCVTGNVYITVIIFLELISALHYIIFIAQISGWSILALLCTTWSWPRLLGCTSFLLTLHYINSPEGNSFCDTLHYDYSKYCFLNLRCNNFRSTIKHAIICGSMVSLVNL